MKISLQSRAQQSRARKQAGLTDVAGVSIGTTGASRKQAGSRSLTVAAQFGAQTGVTSAKTGLPALPTGSRAYFITFSCYGSRVRGDSGGSVDRAHNVFDTPVIKPNAALERSERGRMDQSPYELDAARRGTVLQAIQNVCAHRGWWLFAAHVRATHVHVIVQAGDPPEKVMNDLKIYASRRLNEAGLDEFGCKRWVRHGSTRYLWDQKDLEGAIHYVLHEQGETMATYAAPGLTRDPSHIPEQQSRAQQSRARKQAVVTGVAHVPMETTGDVRKRAGSRSLTVAAQSLAGFTMMEIAISLAIIGIALVAIIGVLPIGMNVQQDNRQETIINQDAAVLVEDLRNGSIGVDELTNYVFAISNYWGLYGQGGTLTQGGLTNWYTYSGSFVAKRYPNISPPNSQPITNGANIIGILSTPEFTDAAGNPINTLLYGGISNHVVASVYSISGLAVQKPPQDNQLMQADSMAYHLYVVNAPTPVDTNLYNTAIYPNGPPPYSQQLDGALRELRLTFLYPLLPNGHIGNGAPKTFRTLVAGQLVHQPNIFKFPVFYPNLYYYQSQSFTNSYTTNAP
jgi:REP element-mobilizing transposase RayT/type II secretory pathway pseudopilin PulG